MSECVFGFVFFLMGIHTTVEKILFLVPDIFSTV